MLYTKKKLRDELLSRIDSNSQKELEKVERYLNLVNIYYSLDESIKEQGSMVITENGAQRFLKPNPAISEKNKISTSLLALEKSFVFVDNDPVKEVPDGSDLI